MEQTIKQLAAIAILMLILDGVWLTSRNAYHQGVFQAIQGSPLQARLTAGLFVYVLMILGLWYFVVRPASSWQTAAAQGAALGAVVYGTYDFTNYATLTRYPLAFAVSDTIWGSALFAVTAAATVWFLNM